MFSRIGAFSVRNRAWIILAWVLLAVMMVLFAPSLRDVATLGEEASLPPGVESLKAKRLLEQSFPGTRIEGTGSLVLYNPSGLTEADRAYGKTVRDWLEENRNSVNLLSVSSVYDNPRLEQYLVSPDKTVMIIQLTFNRSGLDQDTVEGVQDIRENLPPPPSDGLRVHISGEAGISADLIEAVNKGIDRTTQVTVILVIVLLLLIYRSPVASLVPLITIGIAYLVSRGVLGYLADTGLSLWSQVDAYLVVIVFGVGTDYCLFIISRLREQMGRAGTEDPRIVTMSKIGAVITASAATVIVGFLGLLAGRLEMFRTMGPMLALAVLITLLAALTLTPALTSVMGRRLFWPARESKEGHVGAFGWSGVARLVTTRPALSVIITVGILALPYLALVSYHRTFNVLSQLPAGMDSVAGYDAIEDHYDVGELAPLTAVIVAPEGQTLTGPASLAALSQATESLSSIPGVKTVRSAVSPDAGGQALLVSGQLASLSAAVEQAARQVASPQQGAAGELTPLLTTTGDYLQELAAAYPDAVSRQPFNGSLQGLTAIQAMMAGVSQPGSTPSPQHLQQLQTALQDLSVSLSQLGREFSGDNAYLLPRSLIAANESLQGLSSMFFSGDGDAVRLSVILDRPIYSDGAFSTAREVRKSLRSGLDSTSLSAADAAVGGPTAEFADIEQTTDSDFVRVFLVVFAGIFVVLAVLLRSLVAPVYLLLTVLLSFGTTLGLSVLVFQGILGHEGIFYMVPIFLLVILVALGEDYNIFLMSRVREESQHSPTREATRRGSAATGGIITACGLILAGTFAAMTAAPVQTLVQVGGAIAMGVLVDTFLVRGFLVPGIAAMLGRWNWWPGSMGRRPPRA